jgi:hypothetical protein
MKESPEDELLIFQRDSHAVVLETDLNESIIGFGFNLDASLIRRVFNGVSEKSAAYLT